MNPAQARSTSGRLAAGAVLLGAGLGLAAGGPITGTALAAGAGAAALAASKRRGGDGGGDGGAEEEGEEEEEEEVTAVAEAAKEVVVEPEPLAPLRPLEHLHAVKGGRCSSSAPVSTASEGGAAEVLVEAPALAPAPNKMRAASTASCAAAGSGGGGDADLLRLHLQLMPSATKGGHDAVRVRVAWLCD